MNRCLPHACASTNPVPSTRFADSTNRPWGLETSTTWPAKCSLIDCASRCRVWPSGISAGPDNGPDIGPRHGSAGGLRQRGQVAGLLVVTQHRDAAAMACLVAERRAEEHVDEPGHLRQRMHPTTHRDDVRVVVLTSQRGCLLAPHQCRARAPDLVRGHLLTVAGAAHDDAEATLLLSHGLGGA